jgi:tetratricopeptide (TPR) repeat protein
MLAVRPDELEARRYQVLRVDGSGAARAETSLTVETVRQMQLTVEAPMLIGVTDDDLYLFREGRKSRFLSDRRVTYLSVALARQGGSFAAGFTDLMLAGQTLALADCSGKVLWTKDLDAPITAVAISPEGRTVAVGLENGLLTAFDAARKQLWEAVLDAAPVALAMTGQGARCIVVTASAVATAVDHGDVAWRAELPLGAEWTPGRVSATCDADGAMTVLAGGGETEGWVLVLDADGRCAWEQATGARVTGVSLSPSGLLLGVSQADGELLQFEFERGSSTRGADPLAPEKALSRALEARDAGKPDEARQRLLDLLETVPGYVPACEALIALDEGARTFAFEEAQRLAAEARFAGALEMLSSAHAVAPADPELSRRWSEILSWAQAHAADQAAQAESNRDPERAVAHWLSLLQIDPKCLRGRHEVDRLNRQIANQLTRDGEAAWAVGREEEAMAAWRRAQAASPTEELGARLREAEAECCFRVGVALYGQQRFAEAAFQFRKVLAIQPGHAEALRYLAYISSAGPQSPLSERFSRLE